jgi:hypothetical protein
MPDVELISILTCPECGQQHRETMPEDACMWFYECKGCGAMLRPKPGDCCVFCSYGTVKCPPVQRGSDCCGETK